MRFQRQLEAILYSGLLEDMHQVDLDCPDGDRKLSSDLLVLHPAANQRDNLILARSKTRQIAAVEKSDHLVRNRILDPDVAPPHRPKALHNRSHRQRLFQNSPHAALQRSKGLDLGNIGDPEDGMTMQ